MSNAQRKLRSFRRSAARGRFLLFFGLAGLCASSYADDLLEIYRRARDNDPTFAAARHSLEIVQQRVPQARAGLLPTVSVSSSENRNRSDVSFGKNTPSQDRDIRSREWAVQLRQPLLRVQNFHAYGEAEHLAEQAAAQFAQAEQELILRVTQAYFDVVVAEDNIVVAEAQLRAMSEQLAIAKHGFASGTATITDTHEARSRVELARSQRVAALNELETRRAELEKIVGELPKSLVVLRSSMLPPRPRPDDAHAWISHARENHPLVRAQNAALAAAESAVRKNRSEHLPTLDLIASHGKNSASGSLDTPADYSTSSRANVIGVQLAIPIFTGGATRAKVAESLASRGKTQADLEATKRQAATEARQAFSSIANGLSQIEALNSAVESGRSAVEGNRAGYRLGIRINIDVLNAEQQLYSSQRDLTKARYDTLLQGLKLKAAAGILSETDVETINDLLGPQALDTSLPHLAAR